MNTNDKRTATLLARIYRDAMAEADRIDPERKRKGLVVKIDSIVRIARDAHYELTGNAPPESA